MANCDDERRAKKSVSRALVSLLVLLAGCASTTGGPPGDVTDGTGGGPSVAEIEALYRARTDSLRMRFTEADVRWVTDMIAHHAQALEMAALAPTHGASPAVQTLAARIINAQQDEIATLQRWLEDRGLPVPRVHVDGTMVHVEGADHDPDMPGMLTAEQMAALRNTYGPEFDRFFLTLMIQHHNGAVRMVRELFATDGAGQEEEVFRLASDIQVDQITEIRRMESMLATLPSADGR
jgi:uncharacterized protein (DUF305 family)